MIGDLGIELRTASAPLGLHVADLVGLALRRNPRRAHLLVSRVLGKHVPTEPRLVQAAGELLGALVGRVLAGTPVVDGPTRAAGAALRRAVDAAGRDAAELDASGLAVAALEAARAAAASPPGDPLVIGFAETATGLGHLVADAVGADCWHTTRRLVPGATTVVAFEEEHSHATTHRLLDAAGTGPALRPGRAVVLVDDELSTGRTALNTIAALEVVNPGGRYVVAALLDVRPPSARASFDRRVAADGWRVDVVSLARGVVGLPADLPARAADTLASTGEQVPALVPPGALSRLRVAWPADLPATGRLGWSPQHRSAVHELMPRLAAELAAVLALEADEGVLVLGTEELMAVPTALASALAERLPGVEVRVSSTTRSPVAVVDEAGYAVRSGVRFEAHDGTDDGPRFAYNVDGAGPLVVVLDAEGDSGSAAGPGGLLEALASTGRRVVAVRLGTGAAGAAPVAPEPLRGPAFGSYAAAEVGWLLTDISAARIEAPTEEREEAIQSGGAHYAESLPVEYVPGPEYQALFRDALEASAARLAMAVGVVTEQLLASRSRPVVVSLARAGTPIGVLVRRWAQAVHDVELPHYAVSIVRGRGIDPLALRYLQDHHDPAAVAFLDGWTGKGAIARELDAALRAFAAAGGADFPRGLAVLADPGSCVDVWGTREDFLVASACLNSTVSGLVSRTVLNADLIGPGQYHGAKFYAELAGSDVSGAFLDAVSDRFDQVRLQVAAEVAGLSGQDRSPTWEGWAQVEQISVAHGIGDVNLVKPGVGETTRVLLRRVPWKVLVRPGASADVAHVRHLAAERGVPVEEVPGLSYSCVGLIHPRFTRGATGADGWGVG